MREISASHMCDADGERVKVNIDLRLRKNQWKTLVWICNVKRQFYVSDGCKAHFKREAK